MKRTFIIATFVVMIALASAQATLASQTAPRPDDRAELQKIQEDSRRVEEQLELLKRYLRPEFDRAEEEKSLRRPAAAAKLSGLEIRFLPEASRLPLEDGTPSPMELRRVELSGRDPFQNVHHFLSMLDHVPRLAHLEMLRVEAADKDTVRFSARLAIPILTEDPQPQPSLRAGMVAAAREELTHTRAIVFAFSQYLDPARREQVAAALAMLEDEIGTRPIALTEAVFDGNLILRGVLVGAAARAAMKAGLETAGLRTIREEFSPAGICQAFTITAIPERGDRPIEVVMGNGMFDAATSSVCKRELAPLAKPIVAGSSAANGPPPFLRLREVDLADVFSALGDLFTDGFVVDSDVTGRVSLVVYNNASMDDLFGAIRGAGLRMGEAPVRRVSRGSRGGDTKAAAGTKDPGAPVSFTIKDAAVSDVLCLLGQVSGREIVVPKDQQGRLSIFAMEAPMNRLLDEVIDAADLVSAIEGQRLVLRKRGRTGETSGVNICETVPAASPSRLRLPALLTELGTADLELAGLADLTDSWRAYVYGPARHLIRLDAGAQLFDATVKSVGPDGVTFALKNGNVVTVALRR